MSLTCLHCGKNIPDGKQWKFCDRKCAAKYRWSNPEFRKKVLEKSIPLLSRARSVRWARYRALHANDKRKLTREDWFDFQRKMAKKWKDSNGTIDPSNPRMSLGHRNRGNAKQIQ